jgi:hypothetical protein
MYNIIYCYLLFFLQYSFGADDNQSWTKVSFEKKIPFSLKVELAQGLRLKEYVSTFNQAFFELSLSYKDSNGLRINIPYRYTIFEDKIKHRLSFSASYQYSFKPVILKYRIKYYRLYKDGEPLGEYGETLGDLIRSKFKIKYKSGKKTNPYISGELFHLLNTNNNPLDEYRVSFGIEINLPRKNSINIFYIFKKEDNTKSSPGEINVFGLSYISKI